VVFFTTPKMSFSTVGAGASVAGACSRSMIERDHAIETRGLVVGAERYGALHIATTIRDGEGLSRFVEARLLGVCRP
jgi:hypothetical protein